MTVGALPQRARDDAVQAVDYLLNEAGWRVAERFVDAFEASLLFIRQNPAAGSPRFAHDARRPDLRCWPIKGFSNLVFYRQTSQGPEILRILHTARDIPAPLRE